MRRAACQRPICSCAAIQAHAQGAANAERLHGPCHARSAPSSERHSRGGAARGYLRCVGSDGAAAANHDRADLDRSGTGRCIAHPAPHVRVQREVFVAQQHLALAWGRQVFGFQPEGGVVRRALGTLGEDELAVPCLRLRLVDCSSHRGDEALQSRHKHLVEALQGERPRAPALRQTGLLSDQRYPGFGDARGRI